MKPKPFIKWAGGKSQLLDQYQKYYPKENIKLIHELNRI